MVQSLRRITYGRTTIPESWIYAGGDENKKVPIILSVFLIETEDMKLLVDAGCNTMPGYVLEDFIQNSRAFMEKNTSGAYHCLVCHQKDENGI